MQQDHLQAICSKGRVQNRSPMTGPTHVSRSHRAVPGSVCKCKDPSPSPGGGGGSTAGSRGRGLARPPGAGQGARGARHFLSARTAPRVTGHSLRTQGRSGSRRHRAQRAPALPAPRCGPHPARPRAPPLDLGPSRARIPASWGSPPTARGTRPPPLPRPPACRSHTPTARLRRAGQAGRRPPAPTRPAGPFPPPRRAAHWPAAGGGGAAHPQPHLASRGRSRRR